MATLNDQVKLFIVQRLAMFDTLPQVIAAVKETFDLTVSPQQVHFYDPTVGQKPARKWIREFRRTRRRFQQRHFDIAIANKSVRLQRLDRIQLVVEKGKNYALAIAIIEQAAKEMGDAFTNRRELTGKDGAPVIPGSDPIDAMSPDELRAFLASMLTEGAK